MGKKIIKQATIKRLPANKGEKSKSGSVFSTKKRKEFKRNTNKHCKKFFLKHHITKLRTANI